MTALTFIIGAFALWITVNLVWEITVNPLTLFDGKPVSGSFSGFEEFRMPRIFQWQITCFSSNP